MLFSITIIILTVAILTQIRLGAGIDATFGIYKIVPHPGMFHADETAAIGAIKKWYPNVLVERRNPTAADFADPCVLVLDQGGKYDVTMRNMDHHHNVMLPASCVMVLELLPITDMEKWVIYFLWLDKVSQCDINGGSKSYEYNAIVRNFNTLKGGFDKAVAFGTDAFEGYLNTAKAMIKTAAIWGTDIVIDGNVAIYEGDVFLQGWQDFAKADGVDFLVNKASKKRNPGCWQAMATDKDIKAIGFADNQIFRHGTGFVAVYQTQAEAIAHVKG